MIQLSAAAVAVSPGEMGKNFAFNEIPNGRNHEGFDPGNSAADKASAYHFGGGCFRAFQNPVRFLLHGWRHFDGYRRFRKWKVIRCCQTKRASF